MTIRNLCLSFLSIALCLSLAISANANMLTNPGFEDAMLGGGDTFGAPGWTDFGGGTFTVHTSILGGVGAFEGDHAFKMFGAAANGIFQEFPTTPGTQWDASVQLLNFSGDALAADQVGAVNIEWIDAGNNNIGTVFGTSIDAMTAQDQWMPGSASGIAPAGTAMARMVLITGAFGPGGVPGGAPFFDAASFTAVPEPASASLFGLALLGALGLRRRR